MLSTLSREPALTEWTHGARRLAAVAALGCALGGCTGPQPASVDVACAAFALPGGSADGTEATAREPGAGDTLEVVVVFDSLPRGSGGVRVRVDSLAEGGMVSFLAPRPGSAAAGMALATPPRYDGCAALAPDGLQLSASHAPRRKAWVRISTDRPVRLRVAGGRQTLPPLVVTPGASALAPWSTQ
jgi:hypothetical protein